MITEAQIKARLENISDGGELQKFEFTSAERFFAEIRCNIENNKPMDFYNNYIDNWISNFSQFTATKWGAQRSYVKKKTLILQKVFYCLNNDKVGKEDGQPDANCTANIDFKVKITNVDADLNVFVKIQFEHTHHVYTTASSAGRSFSDTDKIFFEYFDNGFNATTSNVYHELTLIEKFGNASAQHLADPNINPTIEHIQYLMEQMQSKEIHRSFTDTLEAKKAFIADSDGTLTYSKKPKIIVIISPLMKKVLMNNNVECVLVDSSLVKYGLVVTYLYVSNKIGALPVACILHENISKSNFRKAFKRLKLTIQSVNNNFNPKIFITNDLPQQKKALSVCFPNSKIITSRWSVCCEIWKWLCSEELKLKYDQRHSIMYLFKSFVYAPAKRMKSIYNTLVSCQYFNSDCILRSYVDALWKRSHEWHTDAEVKLHGLTEASVRLLNEFLRKCRFFNMITMVEVVSKLLEDHHRNLIIKYIDGMPNISISVLMVPLLNNLEVEFLLKISGQSNEHTQIEQETLVKADQNTVYLGKHESNYVHDNKINDNFNPPKLVKDTHTNKYKKGSVVLAETSSESDETVYLSKHQSDGEHENAMNNFLYSPMLLKGTNTNKYEKDTELFAQTSSGTDDSVHSRKHQRDYGHDDTMKESLYSPKRLKLKNINKYTEDTSSENGVTPGVHEANRKRKLSSNKRCKRSFVHLCHRFQNQRISFPMNPNSKIKN